MTNFPGDFFAFNRLDLSESGGEGLPEIMENMTEDGAASKTKGVLEGAKEKLFGSDEDDGEDEGKGDEGESKGSSRSKSSASSRSRSSRSRQGASTRGRS